MLKTELDEVIDEYVNNWPGGTSSNIAELWRMIETNIPSAKDRDRIYRKAISNCNDRIKKGGTNFEFLHPTELDDLELIHI